MDQKELLKDVHDRLDVPGLLSDMLDKILEPALQKIVDDTSNKFDDVLMKAVYPQLEDELKVQAQAYWDKLGA